MSNGEYKLKTMIVDELPLIAFTTCAPAALGVAFVALVEGIVAFSSTGLWFGGWRFAALAVVFTTVGMLASVMHLAKPLRAPRSLANVRSSWLSREILAVSAFWGVLVVWLVLALIASGTLPFARVDAFTALVLGWLSLCVCTVACVVGLLLVFVIARAYRVMGQPGWNGPETLFELLAVALRVGVVAACCLVLLAAEYMDVPLSPWIAALISVVCIGVAIALDKYASNVRMHRLSLEIDAGANPHGRVPAALSCVVTWQAERGYGFALSFSAACFIVLACLVPAFRIIAVVLAMLCVLVAQAMLRAAFYGFCNPSRTASRFPMRRQTQARGQSPRLHA